MIRVDRGPMPQITAFTVASVKLDDGTKVTRATRELERARLFFDDDTHFKDNKKLIDGTFLFDVYKDKDLAAELKRVFGTKCAYCESDFGAVTPKEVEHFRPKSEIDTGAGTLAPGYWWLAAEWTNLLVACVDCNRRRNHEVPGQPGLVNLGKEAQFPLEGEGQRARKPVPGIAGEEPTRLLIDPCTEEPADHLSFDDEALIHPMVGPAGTVSRKGEMSIIVYALQRDGLVKARKAKLLDFRFLVVELKEALKQHHRLKGVPGNDEAVAAQEASMQRLLGKIQDALRPGQEYLGMLRHWIRREKAAQQFIDLEQFGIDLEQLI